MELILQSKYYIFGMDANYKYFKDSSSYHATVDIFQCIRLYICAVFKYDWLFPRYSINGQKIKWKAGTSYTLVGVKFGQGVPAQSLKVSAYTSIVPSPEVDTRAVNHLCTHLKVDRWKISCSTIIHFLL